MGIDSYWGFLRRRWLSIVICTLLGIAISVVLTVTAPRTYSATTQMFVSISSAVAPSDPVNGAQFITLRVHSYAELGDSPDVLQPVIDQLDLGKTPQQLASTISVSNPPQSVILNVQASSSSPAEASAVSNATATQLAKYIQTLEAPSKEMAPVHITITKPATTPSAPSSPRPILNVGLGFTIGLAIGIIWALIREARKRSQATESIFFAAPLREHQDTQ